MSTQNAAVLTQIALQLAVQFQDYLRLLAQVHAEGRDVTDEELAAARARVGSARDQAVADADRATPAGN